MALIYWSEPMGVVAFLIKPSLNISVKKDLQNQELPG